MKKLVLFFVVVIGFSSCRPAYMRCPKGRRCVEKVIVSEKQLIASYEVKREQF